MHTAEIVALSACAVVMAWLTALATNTPTDKPATEFVCLIEDKLSERHVGVAYSEPWEGGLIHIVYVDGPAKWYRPREGESCGDEEVGGHE